MANPILPTNGTHELQERYAQAIVALKRKENVVRNLFRKDYEGSPLSGAVKIPTRNTEVVVGDYDVAAGGTLGTGATTYTTVTISKNQYVNELIDGYEANAVPDNIIAQRLDSAAYSMGRTQELYAIGKLEATTSVETSTALLTTSTAYGAIVNSIATLKKLGININDIKVVVSVDTEATLYQDVKFSNSAGVLGAELIRQGVIGKIVGAEVYTSANLTQEGVAEDDVNVEYVVFSPLWAQTVEEWMVMPSIQDLKDGKHIGASALQGRMVYEDSLLDVTTCRKKTYVVPEEEE